MLLSSNLQIGDQKATIRRDIRNDGWEKYQFHKQTRKDTPLQLQHTMLPIRNRRQEYLSAEEIAGEEHCALPSFDKRIAYFQDVHVLRHH